MKQNEIKDMNPEHPRWIEFCTRLMQSKLNRCHSDRRELKELLTEFNASGKWLEENDATCLCQVQSEIIDSMYIYDQLPLELHNLYEAGIKAHKFPKEI